MQSNRQETVITATPEVMRESRRRLDESHKTSWSRVRDRKTFRSTKTNLLSLKNTYKAYHPTGWEDWSSAVFWLLKNDFKVNPTSGHDQDNELLYQMESDDSERGLSLKGLGVDLPVKATSLYSKGSGALGSCLVSVPIPSEYKPDIKDAPPYKSPVQHPVKESPSDLIGDRNEVITLIWKRIEPILKKYGKGLTYIKGKKNSRLEAFLSDCSLAIMETSDFGLAKLMICLANHGRLTKHWKRTFSILAYRRRVSGFDIGEVIDVGKFYEEQRRATEEFWDKVPANHKDPADLIEDEECPQRHAFKFVSFIADMACIQPEEDSLLKVAFGLCLYPGMTATETAKQLKMGKTTFYDNWNHLKGRLECAALFELSTTE